ncbi:putative amino acid permease [Streptomyces spiroverticillatus]|uniref:Amino acid permease n=1 Tax=Streptomyces finlayi TaxID=67296 RepID=A0A918X1Q5_9ACTN|nr:APC family permease [Streptomyces finlayi]GHA22161.1 putative amino acid permease [Streptomyces spiroverticillatus]GHD04238.1 putative amino acid permease [Streptomyces finlayi]
MTAESAPERPPALTDASTRTGKGLRSGSVGLLASVALGLSSVAPAYSIAVTLGFVTLVAGHFAPAALLLGFVPILLTAFAFRELNREMPDCGTTFVWSTRAFGPYLGWLSGGWVVQCATVIAMTALGRVGASYLLDLLGLHSLAANGYAVAGVAVLLLGAATAVAYRGIHFAASVQYVLLGLQLLALLAFGIAAFAGDGGSGAETPSLTWLNPFGFDGLDSFAQAVLLCLFIYWGWDALLTVNEETTDAGRTPGKAAVISTLVLLATYLFTAFAAISFAGTGTEGLGLGSEENAADVLATLAPPVVGDALAKVIQLAVCVSAVSALLTCLVGTSRATLSMSAHGALPKRFARIHPRFGTPSFGTVFFGVAAAVTLTLLTIVSTDFLGDVVLSVGLLIAFYYGITGLACVWYFRHQLRDSARDFLLKGLLPLLGSLMMVAAFGRSAYDMLDPAYGSTSIGGVGGVFLLGVGSIAVGALALLAVRARFGAFFRDGRTAVTEQVVTLDD